MTRAAATPKPDESPVWQGDAYDLAEKLEPASVDLIITSPPYWGMRTYGLEHNGEILQEWLSQGESAWEPPPYDWYRSQGGLLGMEPVPEWFTYHLVEIFGRLRPALKASGSMWINIGDTYFARWSSIRHDGRQGLGDNPRSRRRTPMGGYRQEKQLMMIPARLAIGLQEDRWILRNDLIWSKPNVPPRPEKDRLRLTHEHFFHFVLRPREGRAKYYYALPEAEPGARDVVTVNVRAGSDGHSATFPSELIEPRIRTSCPPGGVVLDPFAGTGTALQIAAETGREPLGFEMSEEFVVAARTNVARSLDATRVHGAGA